MARTQIRRHPYSLGMWKLSEVTWPSHDDHTTMCHPCCPIGRPLSQWTWDLRVPTLFIFQSISILLCANASLIAPQWSYAYLFSFPTWRPIVCTPVPCSHPCSLHLHVDSHPSYRYPPVSALILLYFPSLIIISLIPLEHFPEEL